ncbi:ha-tagged protein kinase, partial [Tribonema minus]
MTASAAGGIGITTRGNGGDACLAAPQVAHGKGQGVGEWVLGRMLGRGAFGVVYKARLVPSGETVAVKTINIDGLNENELRAVENEIMMMRHLHHPNVVHYLGMEAHPKHLNIFLEYVDGGSLRKMLEKTGPLSEPHTACNTKQILEGLRHLHTRNITHRDVKGANILVCRDGSLKLADFGAAKRMGHESVCGGLKGTPHWMAPEVIRGQQMASGWFKADVWSVGCTVVEMLTGRMPWPNISNPMAAMYRIANGEKPPLDRDISPEASAFVDSCCSADPMQRKSVDQLMQSAFL